MQNDREIDISVYLRGERLIGDDFDAEGIQQWFQDEEEGYSALGAEDRDAYGYVYHALNRRYGFSALPDDRPIVHALGLGSAYGDELLPVIHRIERLTIVEASEVLRASDVGGRAVNYVSPEASGSLPFPDGTFDLITCFGVLHHIPNVSFLISELSRVLVPDGVLLLREPIVNMGDWRQPRRGLTARERGIPKPIMEAALGSANLVTEQMRYLDFPPFVRILALMGVKAVFNSPILTTLDGVLASLFSWNTRYDRPRIWNKFAPASAFWVCRKPVLECVSGA